MRDTHTKAKQKKLGSGSAARKILRDESMSFLSEIKTTNTRFASAMLNVENNSFSIRSINRTMKLVASFH